MKQSGPLEFVEAGTLPRPGLIGRAMRLALGVLCLYALSGIVDSATAIIARPYSRLGELALLIAVAVCLFNYVVNIGFSRSWGWRPLIVSLAVLTLAAGAGFLVSGSFDSPVFGVPLLLWLGYFYVHLGLSFVVAALFATPGCEMRSIPEAFGRLAGRPAQEHGCPVAFLRKIDEWEGRLHDP